MPWAPPRRLLLITLTALAVMASGCGEDPTLPDPPAPRKDMGETNDMNPADMGGGDPDLGTPDMDMGCTGRECGFTFTKFGACNQVVDLGTIDTSRATQKDAYGNTTDLIPEAVASCSGFGDEAPEFIFAFQVTDDALADMELQSISQFAWAVALREGACDEAADVQCNTSGTDGYTLKAGTQYFLIVEPSAGVDYGEFELTLDLTPLACAPLGGRSCSGSDLKVCEVAGEASYACGAACAGDACGGDSCDTAIALSGAGSYTYEGDLNAYTSTFDAADIASCALDGTLSTPGAEQIFRVTGLQAGQTVEIQANAPTDMNDDVIFVLDGCGATAACLEVKDLGDRLTWTAPAAGDYTIIIDNLAQNSAAYTHTITILDPL